MRRGMNKAKRRISGDELYDLRAQAEYTGEGAEFEATGTDGFGDSVGGAIVAALAMEGRIAGCMPTGLAMCETDELVIRGERFPANVPPGMIERFNAITCSLDEDIMSRVRYKIVAAFWHPDRFDEMVRDVIERERMAAARERAMADETMTEEEVYA